VGAVIGVGAVIDVVISKYNCNKYNDLIRIGCETHTTEEWSSIEFQEELATKHDRVWWESRGRKILAFLMES